MIAWLQKYLPVALGAVLAAGLPGAGQAHVNSHSPREMVRTLQGLQDDVAVGRTGALNMQVRALSDLGTALRQTDTSVFEEDENLYALITYLFNGGNPQIVETILKDMPENPRQQNLINGALAYAHNHRREFMEAFARPMPETAEWPEALRLSVYLGTAADLAETNPQAASKRLDYVRLAAPGSLFEEAAIRRQLKVSASLGDTVKIALLKRNYVDRFNLSPFANDFWSEFSRAVPRMDVKMTDKGLDELTFHAPASVQYLIYLRIARIALIDGRMERARYSAAKAQKLATDLKKDAATATLYYAASQVGTPAASEASTMLQSIKRDDLAERDRPLLDAAQAVAHGVVRLPASPVSEPAGTQQQQDNNSGDETLLPPRRIFEPLNPLAVQPPAIITPNEKPADYKDEIDDFLKETQNKIDAVDRLLEEQQE